MEDKLKKILDGVLVQHHIIKATTTKLKEVNYQLKNSKSNFQNEINLYIKKILNKKFTKNYLFVIKGSKTDVFTSNKILLFSFEIIKDIDSFKIKYIINNLNTSDSTKIINFIETGKIIEFLKSKTPQILKKCFSLSKVYTRRFLKLQKTQKSLSITNQKALKKGYKFFISYYKNIFNIPGITYHFINHTRIKFESSQKKDLYFPHVTSIKLINKTNKTYNFLISQDLKGEFNRIKKAKEFFKMKIEGNSPDIVIEPFKKDNYILKITNLDTFIPIFFEKELLSLIIEYEQTGRAVQRLTS